MSELEPTRTYSNPKATDVLCRMLDERGVEHYDGTERTLWGYEQTGEDTGIYRFAASEISGGFLQFDMFRITPEQAIAATLGDADATGERQRDAVEVVRCRDCKHGHITVNGKSCKWCDLIATHDPDGCEPYNGYDPEPYFDADFFCAWGKRRESE